MAELLWSFPSNLRSHTGVFRCGVYWYCLNPQTNRMHLCSFTYCCGIGNLHFPLHKGSCAHAVRTLRALSPKETRPRKEFVCYRLKSGSFTLSSPPVSSCANSVALLAPVSSKRNCLPCRGSEGRRTTPRQPALRGSSAPSGGTRGSVNSLPLALDSVQP